MSAAVLPFVTREVYEDKALADISLTPATPEEIKALEQFKALYDHSVKALGLLQTFYKKTGKWKPENDELMARMVYLTTIISANLSGVRNAKTEGQQEQVEGIEPTPNIAGTVSTS